MKKGIAVNVENIHKYFLLPHQQSTTLKVLFVNPLRYFKKFIDENQKTLDGISFKVKEGEFFGIVGRNGSGKSTLLKCLAGVYTPNSGKIAINGKLVPFIELGVGFNPELSGRDNVYLNGALLGFSRKEMFDMYNEIVEFAELGNFMDQKLKNYSSGMQVRLAFSIAIQAKGDILLLDEVLAVGDNAFQQKCFDYFAALKRNKKTIIFVSHSMPTIERFCDRALLIEKGKILHIGSSSEVAGVYEDMMLKEISDKEEIKKQKSEGEYTVRSEINASVEVYSGKVAVKTLKVHDDYSIKIKISTKVAYSNISVGVNIRNSEGILVFAFDSRDHIKKLSIDAEKDRYISINSKNIFTNGKYFITLGISDEFDASQKQLFKRRNINSFTVYGVRKNASSIIQPIYTVVDS